jgi:hypothetical protein
MVRVLFLVKYGSHVKPSTRTSLIRAYGYLPEFSRRNGFFDQNAEAGAHVMPELIDAFVGNRLAWLLLHSSLAYTGCLVRFPVIVAGSRSFSPKVAAGSL